METKKAGFKLDSDPEVNEFLLNRFSLPPRSKQQQQPAPVVNDEVLASDYLKQVGAGITDIGTAGASVLNLATGGASRQLSRDLLGRSLTDITRGAGEALTDTLSPGAKAALEKRFISEQKGELFGEAATDLNSIGLNVARSLPSIIPGAGAGALAARGAGKLAARGAVQRGLSEKAKQAAVKKAGQRAAVTVGGATEGAIAGGLNADDVEQAALNTPREVIATSPFYQSLIDKGIDADEAQVQTARKAAESVFLPTAAQTAIIGIPFNRYLGNLFSSGGRTGLLGRAREGVAGAATEAPVELLQSAGEELQKQRTLRDVAGGPEIDLSQVAEAGAAGFFAGGALGGGVGAAAGGGPVQAQSEAERDVAEDAELLQLPPPQRALGAPEPALGAPPSGPNRESSIFGVGNPNDVITLPDGSGLRRYEIEDELDSLVGLSSPAAVTRAVMLRDALLRHGLNAPRARPNLPPPPTDLISFPNGATATRAQADQLIRDLEAEGKFREGKIVRDIVEIQAPPRADIENIDVGDVSALREQTQGASPRQPTPEELAQGELFAPPGTEGIQVDERPDLNIGDISAQREALAGIDVQNLSPEDAALLAPGARAALPAPEALDVTRRGTTLPGTQRQESESAAQRQRQKTANILRQQARSLDKAGEREASIELRKQALQLERSDASVINFPNGASIARADAENWISTARRLGRNDDARRIEEVIKAQDEGFQDLATEEIKAETEAQTETPKKKALEATVTPATKEATNAKQKAKASPGNAPSVRGQGQSRDTQTGRVRVLESGPGQPETKPGEIAAPQIEESDATKNPPETQATPQKTGSELTTKPATDEASQAQKSAQEKGGKPQISQSSEATSSQAESGGKPGGLAETTAQGGGNQGGPSEITRAFGDSISDFDLDVQLFDRFLSGEGFKDITAARKFAETVTRKKVAPGTLAAKDLDERIEFAAVRAAREAVDKGGSNDEIFDRLVRLNESLPNLGVRTSTSVQQQAFSTPQPIAFVAARLAGIDSGSTVYEPSAGNGALLLTSGLDKAVTNEINKGRASNLKRLGFQNITTSDAVDFSPEGGPFNTVIANPPFGITKEKDGKTTRRFQPDPNNPAYDTAQIDHAIALKALEQLEDNGDAVLLLGGVKSTASTPEARSDGYSDKPKREFYLTLYNQYNVVDHFTLAGKLYARQGAQWPIDVVVIRGRGKSARKLPAADVPQVIESFEELKGKLDGIPKPSHTQASVEPGQRTDESVGDTDKREGGGIQSGGIPGSADRPGGVDDRAGKRQSIEQGVEGQPDIRGGAEQARSARPAGRAEPGQSEKPGTQRTESQPRVPDVDQRTTTGQPAAVETQAEPSSPASVASNRSGNLARVPTADGDVLAKQVGYSPQSKKGRSLDTLIPGATQTAAKKALANVDKTHGDIDAFVANELGIKADDIPTFFSAEQIDAIGLALSNFDKDAGFILGDQTGIGKGRVVAAMIKYALKNGQTPIFVTEKPGLYKDIYRDLVDIGVTDIKPLATNNGQNIDLDTDNGVVLRTEKGAKHEVLLQKLSNEGSLGDDFNMVFTTYNQLQTVKGNETTRRQFLDQISAGSMLIFDESHNAGGQQQAPEEGPARKAKIANRAELARQLAGSAKNVLYSSATYAKRPDVMDLYFRTDMALAVPDIKDLGSTIAKGGVPMQQMVASMLTESGQYLRRERSFDGVSYDTPLTPVDRAVYGEFSNIIRTIQTFSEKFIGAIAKDASKTLKESAASLGTDAATGKVGAESTNFTSIMHNVIDQMLLAIKADQAADIAIDQLKQGNKPLITVANTMESFLSEYAADTHLQTGDPVALSFNNLLQRYLDRSRVLIIKKSFEKASERRYITDAELGARGLAFYNKTKESIKNANVQQLPVSPIDHILGRLRDAGYKVGEITGRQLVLNADKGGNRLATRKDSTRLRNKTVTDFNTGELDAVILNQSGATGLSLHASETFKNKDGSEQAKRVMIIAQPERNIDTYMQMLGRVHRTGQIKLPAYIQMIADIPAEKRVAAILSKKMASLNANTTGARGSSMEMGESPDFLNEIGDQIVGQLIRDDPDLNLRLGNPMKGSDASGDKDGVVEDIARKVTGRIPLLPIKEQDQLYARIETEFTETLAQLDALGENSLEAKTLPLDAKVVESTVLVEGRPGIESPFASAVNMETVNVKRLGKPFTSAQVIDRIAKFLNTDADNIEAQALQFKETTARELKEKFNPFIEKELARFKDEKVKHAQQLRLEDSLRQVNNFIESFPPNTKVRITTLTQEFHGVVGAFEKPGKTKNPAALGSWKATLYLADAARQLKVPLSRIGFDPNSDENLLSSVVLEKVETLPDGEPVMQAFDDMQTVSREERFMVTGNLLAGFNAARKQGQIINFTDASGNVRQGVFMPRSFDPEAMQQAQPVPFDNAEQVLAYTEVSPGRSLPKSADGVVKIIRSPGGEFAVDAEAAKSRGGKYYLNQAVLDAAGRDFVKVGNVMRLSHLNRSEASRIIQSLIDIGANFQANTHKDEARRITGAQADEPLKRASRVSSSGFSQKPGPGISEDVARAEVIAFQRKYRGTQPIKVEVFANQKAAGFGDQAPLKALFIEDQGKVLLFANNLSSAADVNKALRHELVAHFGLRKLLGQDFEGLIDSLLAARKTNSKINKLFDQVARDYPDVSERELADEVLARVAEQNNRAGFFKSAWLKLAAMIRKVFGASRNLGVSEIQSLVQESADRLRDAPGKTATGGAGVIRGQRVGNQGDTNNRARVNGVNSAASDAFQEGKTFANRHLRSLHTTFRPKWLQLLGRKQLVDMYQPIIKGLKRFDRLMQRMAGERTKRQAKASEIVEAWRKLPQQVADNVADIMHRATLAEVYPNKPFERSESVQEKNRKRAELREMITAIEATIARTGEQTERQGATLESMDAQIREIDARLSEMRVEHKKLVKEFNKLPQDAVDVYQNAERAYKESRAETVAALVSRVKRAAVDDKTRQGLIDKIRKHFKNQVKGAYFPLFRFGDFVVTGRKPEDAQDTVVFTENLAQAEAEIERLKAEGLEVDAPRKRQEYAGTLQSTSEGFIGELNTLLKAEGVDENLLDAINQLFLQSLPELSLRKHQIHRRKVPGYSSDARRGFAKYMFHGAFQLTKMKYADLLRSNIDAMQAKVSTMPGGKDQIKAQQVMDEIKQRHQLDMNPNGSVWSQRLTAFGFLQFLGLTPAAAAVNLAQVPIVTFPLLAARTRNAAGALKALTQAYRDIPKMMVGKDKGWIDIFQMARNQDERDALKNAIENNFMDVTWAHSLAGVSQGQNEHLTDIEQKVMRYGSSLFHGAELTNRVVTFLAAYRMAKADGKKSPQASEFARAIIDGSHFDYTKENRPRFMQGNVARVIFLFKQYAQNMVYLQARTFQQAIAGESKAVRKEALKTFTGIWGMSALFSGAMGLPIFTAAKVIMEAMFDDEDEPYDFDVEFRNYLADHLGHDLGEAIARGVPRAVLPGDVAARMKLTGMVFQDEQYDLEGRAYYHALMEDVLGPVVGAFGQDVFEAVKLINEGKVQRGMERVLPKAVRDISKTYRYFDEGLVDRNNNPLVEDLTAGELVGQLVGFAPVRGAEHFEAKAAIKNKQSRLNRRRILLMRKLFLARNADDSDAIAETMQEIVRFNGKNPDFRITQDSLRKSIQQRARIRAGRSELNISVPPKQRRLLDEGRFAR